MDLHSVRMELNQTNGVYLCGFHIAGTDLNPFRNSMEPNQALFGSNQLEPANYSSYFQYLFLILDKRNYIYMLIV